MIILVHEKHINLRLIHTKLTITVILTKNYGEFKNPLPSIWFLQTLKGQSSFYLFMDDLKLHEKSCISLHPFISWECEYLRYLIFFLYILSIGFCYIEVRLWVKLSGSYVFRKYVSSFFGLEAMFDFEYFSWQLLKAVFTL